MRLCAKNLSLFRGGRRLFADLSFEVLEGEAMLVRGSNGAGKSSLLRAIAGYLRFSSGAVRLEGEIREKATLGEQTHYLGHENSLRGALSVGENLSFWADLLGGSSALVEVSLARLGLPHVKNFPVRALSAGQKRRVALARLLVAPRKLWLLDEPTTALDAGSQALFAVEMQSHLSNGGLIIAATHTELRIKESAQIDLDTDGSFVGTEEL